MDEREKDLPSAEWAEHTLNLQKTYDTDKKECWALGLMALLCLLVVDTVLWYGPGLGVTVTVALWYALVFAYAGTAGLRRTENKLLLVAIMLLALSLALGSNPYFQVWNMLALLALLPIHAFSLSGAATLPWWRPAMLLERAGLFGKGFFGTLGASWQILCNSMDKKKWRGGKIALGCVLATVVVAGLIVVLASADELFRQMFVSFLTLLGNARGGEILPKILLALVLTPFAFGFLYVLRRPQGLQHVPVAKVRETDGLPFIILLGAMVLLYVLYLAVQSAGLFGGEAYLKSRGLIYAEWARSGFFQLVFVTVVNLTLMMAAVQYSRKEGNLLRVIAAILTLESMVLLGSAAWRMTLYVQSDGLTFKRIMTYWGMAVMAIFWIAAAIKIFRPTFSFCRVAFLTALLGWVLITYTPVDYLVARNQTARFYAGENATASASYLAFDLSFDTLGPLAETGVAPRFVQQRREDAQSYTAHWQSWNLSAWLAGKS